MHLVTDLTYSTSITIWSDVILKVVSRSILSLDSVQNVNPDIFCSIPSQYQLAS